MTFRDEVARTKSKEMLKEMGLIKNDDNLVSIPKKVFEANRFIIWVWSRKLTNTISDSLLQKLHKGLLLFVKDEVRLIWKDGVPSFVKK